MKLTALALLFSVQFVFCQVPQRTMQDLLKLVIVPGGYGDTYYPTNIPGYPAYGWWVAQGNFEPTGGTWTNLSSLLTNAAALDLTNKVNAHPTYVPAAVNGRAALLFDGITNYVKSMNYTSAQPHDVWLVLACTNQATERAFCSGGRTLYYHRFTMTPGQYRIRGSSTTARGVTLTNQWVIVRALFNGATVSQVWTNGLQAGADANAGTSGTRGFTAGSSEDLALPFNGLIAEIVTYQTNLAAAEMTNLTYYLAKKYAIIGALNNLGLP